MADLDVTDILLDPDFADFIWIERRHETIDNHGRSQTTMQRIQIAAVLFNLSNELVTNPDERHLPDVVEVHTPFRLRGPAPGYQPDYVLIGQDRYIVDSTNNYSRFGQGFIMASCSAVQSMDAPP